MDIHGRNPTSKCGEYFYNHDQWWGQVAAYCLMVAPEICAPCKYWNGNDGYPVGNDSGGLDAAGAVALADALQKEVDSGRTETFAQELASLAPESDDCEFCGGTGSRMFAAPRIADDLKEGGSKREGASYVRPRAFIWPFSTQNVAEFAAFLRESGGFSIS